MAGRRNRTSIAFVLLALVAGACGDSGDRVAATMKGRTFLSESVTVQGQPRPLLPATQVRITFSTDGRITASAGCNLLSGTVRTEDDHLVIADLASTEMGCDPARHVQDEWLSSVLVTNPTFAIDGAQLELRSGDTVLRLLDRAVADPDRPLQATVWVLDGLIDGAIASSIPAGASATMIFDGTQMSVEIDSCNQIAGRVKVTTATIEFDVDGVDTTDIACNGPAAALEAAILAVLDGKITYDIEAASLRLLRPNGKGLTLRAQ